jgi:hypothetical protein
MLFPMTGFLMFLMPMAGFAAGIVLCFIRRLRFLAPFAFLVPLLASYGALAGFFGAGLGLESIGLRQRTILAIGVWLGLLLGGALGTAVGVAAGTAVNRAIVRRRSSS